MKSFSLCLFFLAGKTREFRVPSLCLHVFPAAALTPSNTLRHLTNSSLGFKWRGGKTLKVHPGIWDVVSNGERQKTFVIIWRCSALPLVKNKTIRIKGRMLKLGLASLSVLLHSARNSLRTKVAFWPHCNPSFHPLPLLISQSRRQQRGCCRISCLPIKRQACQLSLTVAEWSQTRGKTHQSLNNSHRGHFSPLLAFPIQAVSFFFSIFAKTECFLLSCQTVCVSAVMCWCHLRHGRVERGSSAEP